MRLADEAQDNRLRAVVMIETDPKQADRVSVELKKMPEVRSLAAVSGSYDLIATIETERRRASTRCSTASAARRAWRAPCRRSSCQRSFRGKC